MFELDEKFLEDLGLGELPEEQKKPFLQHIYNELELRVGNRLSEGMSNDQLNEFESIIDRNEEAVDSWLEKNIPNYQTEENFVKFLTKSGLPANDFVLKSEYVATKWLEKNRPDYRNVVSQVLDEIKREVVENKNTILGN
ncbi:MAG TPA: DUF5663 domain-containing protein [Candidatus Saccharibacteria bacterium]|nr:DUF5663 domain-containing protein [Candidatus Saccharibacteria bacterium]